MKAFLNQDSGYCTIIQSQKLILSVVSVSNQTPHFIPGRNADRNEESKNSEGSMTEPTSTTQLAINGGQPAVTATLPPMFPGGMWIDHEEEEAVLDALRSKRLFRYYGPNPGASKAAELEAAFKAHVGTQHALAVTSGTAALISALAGLGIGPGMEVIVPAYTWIASASAVVAVGAVPVMAEVDESLTLEPVDLEAKISPYTRAVMAVHMRGAPCQMEAVLEVARRHDLLVLEDAAQANGASYQGKKLGAWGDAGAFSLQFNKIITSGEGGMVTTNDEAVFERAVMFHDVVGGQRNDIPESRILPGINFRMPELLAAVALVQLRRLEALLAAMRMRKQFLKTNLEEVARRKGIQFRTLHDPQGEAAICLVLLLPEADHAQKVCQALDAEGLPNWLLYHPEHVDYHVYAHWTPIMNQRAWTPNGGPWKNHPRKVEYSPAMCPRTLELLGRAVHIDISPDLSNPNLEEISEALNKVLAAF
jgi:8-amino-3,8-dideoxy-alpha-D-manno-octulosonate transaminase